jgi:diguanylate cyclase (GGDEF)-like protein
VAPSTKAPSDRIAQALSEWRTREGTLLLVLYGLLIAAFCPAFYFVTRLLPGHLPDSLLIRSAASAVSLLLVLGVAVIPLLRPYAYRLQVVNISAFLVVLLILLVNSGNSLWFLTLTVIGLFAVQYAFLRWQDLAVTYTIAIDFEIVYSSLRVGFMHYTNLFALSAVAFACVLCVVLGIPRIRSLLADVESRTRLEMQTEELRRQAQRIRHLAYSDTLTGVANRAGMNERVDRAIDYASKHRLLAAILYLDLDGFKEINDTHGHDIGDVVLLGAALRIQYVLRHGESIGRIGGDEFVVLIPSCETSEEVYAVKKRIVDVLHEPFAVGDEKFALSASIGTAIFPQDGHTRLELLAHADQAMYHIKRERRRQPTH